MERYSAHRQKNKFASTLFYGSISVHCTIVSLQKKKARQDLEAGRLLQQDTPKVEQAPECRLGRACIEHLCIQAEFEKNIICAHFRHHYTCACIYVLS